MVDLANGLGFDIEKVREYSNENESSFGTIFAKYGNVSLCVFVIRNMDEEMITKLLRKHQRFVNDCIENERTFVVGYDLREAKDCDMNFSKLVASSFEDMDTEYAHCKCTFVLVPNEALANIINMSMLLFKPVCPFRLVHKEDEVNKFVLPHM